MARADQLELLSYLPAGTPQGAPLLFVHGAYTGAWCWEEHFLPWFAAQGRAAYALSLSGHGGSPGREYLDALSVEDYVADVRGIIARLPARPVLVGHSMGGMVLQKYLEHEDAPGVVLMSAVPPNGLASATYSMMMQRPGLLLDLNRLMGGGVPHLESLRDALFYQPVSNERLHYYFMRCQPESMRAIWDMSLFNLPRPARMHRPPMLVLGAAHDNLIPESLVRQTAATYDVPAQIFPDMGHGMMLESNWEQATRYILDWLQANAL